MDKRIKGSRDRTAEPPRPSAGGIWLAIAAFAALIVALVVVRSRPAPLMRGLSLGLLGLAVLFGGLPFVQLRRYGAVAPGARFTATTAVAQRGLYAIVRHPQYLGYDLLAWGLATSAPHWGTVLPAIILTAAVSMQARTEERYLLERFGDTYRAYMRTVPRFGVITGLVRLARRRRGARG